MSSPRKPREEDYANAVLQLLREASHAIEDAQAIASVRGGDEGSTDTVISVHNAPPSPRPPRPPPPLAVEPIERVRPLLDRAIERLREARRFTGRRNPEWDDSCAVLFPQVLSHDSALFVSALPLEPVVASPSSSLPSQSSATLTVVKQRKQSSVQTHRHRFSDTLFFTSTPFMHDTGSQADVEGSSAPSGKGVLLSRDGGMLSKDGAMLSRENSLLSREEAISIVDPYDSYRFRAMVFSRPWVRPPAYRSTISPLHSPQQVMTPVDAVLAAVASSTVSLPSDDYSPNIPLSPITAGHQWVSDELERITRRIRLLQSQSPADTELGEFARTMKFCNTRTIHLRRLLHLYSSQIYHATQYAVSALHADQLAFQITLLDWSIFSRIHPGHDLMAYVHGSSLSSSSSRVMASMDFFNYLTRSLESSIIEPDDAATRAQHVHHWIKVANRLFQLRSYNALKAIISSLGTPPIARLKKTWSLVPKKSLSTLEDLRRTMSEQDNYAKYRELLAKAPRPVIPFLGVFVHDLTYLNAAVKQRDAELLSLDVGIEQKDTGPSPLNITVKQRSPPLDIAGKPRQDTPYPSTSPQKELSTHLKAILFQFEYFQSGPTYDKDPQFMHCGSKQHRDFLPRREASQQAGQDDFACDPAFCVHWLLTRPYLTEKQADDLSALREPPSTVTSSHRSLAPSVPLPASSGTQVQANSGIPVSTSGGLSISTTSDVPVVALVVSEEAPMEDSLPTSPQATFNATRTVTTASPQKQSRMSTLWNAFSKERIRRHRSGSDL